MNTLVDQECPCVTVLLPVLDGEEFIEKSLNSIVGQKHIYEVIIVDNGSSDKTPTMIRNFSAKFQGVKIISERNPGIVSALNAGLDECKSPFIARLDADDEMKPSRIEKQVDFMHLKSEVVVVGSQIDYIDEVGTFISKSHYPLNDSEIRFKLFYKNPIAHPSTLIRTDKLLSIGGYDKRYEGAEDLALWFSLLALGELHNLQESLTSYRIHKKQFTKTGGSYSAELRFRTQLAENMNSLSQHKIFGGFLNQCKCISIRYLKLFLKFKASIRNANI